jgi:hypothetical protein
MDYHLGIIKIISTCNNVSELKVCWVKEVRHKRELNIWVHLYEVLE